MAPRREAKRWASTARGEDLAVECDEQGLRAAAAAKPATVVLLSATRSSDARLSAELESLGVDVNATTSAAEAVERIPNMDAILIDVGPAWEPKAEALVRWSRHLLEYRREHTVFVCGNVAPPAERAALIEAGVEGLYSHTLDPAVVAAWISQATLVRKRQKLADSTLTLDAANRTVRFGDRIAVLSPLQFAVMHELLAASGMVTRETLRERVWGGRFQVELRTVDTTVSRLRGRLRSAMHVDDLIRTIANRGYLGGRPSVELDPKGGGSLANDAPLRCWLSVGDDAQWGTLQRLFGTLTVAQHRLGVDADKVPPEDLVVLHAEQSGVWFAHWQALTRHRPNRIGFIIPGSESLPSLVRAAGVGNLQLLSPTWLAADAPVWLRWYRRWVRPRDPTASGGMRLLPSQFLARLGGVTVPLPRKDFEVLEVLHRFAGRVVSREQLRELVWAGRLSRESRSVDIRISSLRRHLRRYVCEGPPSIETVAKVGYRLHL